MDNSKISTEAAAETAPDWFLENLKKPGESIITKVAGRSVHMLTWNWQATDLPTLALVHGFGAHAYWWSYLAPFFIDTYRVAAIDLPGMGDSEPPMNYEDNCFAQAIINCIEQHRLDPVRIIGHSFGGAQSMRAMGMAPQLFEYGIIVDTNVRLAPEPLIRKLQPKGTHKQSVTREACEARFRLVPPQPNYIDPLVQHIAHHSCTSDQNGWHWKADPNCINVGEIEDAAVLHAVSTRVDLIYGENSFLNVDNKPQKLLNELPNCGQLVTIPKAGHHIMVDYPMELVSAIKELLAAQEAAST